MMEISHHSWRDKPSNSHVDGTDPITAFYGTGNLEVTQLLQLLHMSSIGDHRTWIVEVTMRSILGCNLLKIQRTVGRRLTMSNHSAVTEYIRLVKKGCEEHKISNRLDECLRLVNEFGVPTPKWLKKKIRRVHDEFDEIRLHAERNCRKLYTPESPCSPVIQAWYDRIHAYLALIKILEDPARRNVDNVYRFAVLDGKRYGPGNIPCWEMKEGQERSRYPNLIRVLTKELEPSCRRSIWERFRTQTDSQVSSGTV